MKIKEELAKRKPSVPNDDILLPNTSHDLRDIWEKKIYNEYCNEISNLGTPYAEYNQF